MKTERDRQAAYEAANERWPLPISGTDSLPINGGFEAVTAAMTTKELLVAALQRVVDEVMASAGGRISDEALDQAREVLVKADKWKAARLKRRERHGTTL